MNFLWDPILFWLIAARVSGVLAALPMFSEISVPTTFKALLVFWIAALLMFAVPPSSGIMPTGFFGLALLIGGELFLGIGIGVLIRYIFASIEFAGSLIDHEMGMMAAQQINPNFPITSGGFKSILGAMGMMLFLALDFLNVSLLAVRESFILLPPGTFYDASQAWPLFLRASAGIIVGGIMIAAPFIAISFFINVALGFLAKAVQGVNIFFESFTIRLIIGMGAMIVLLPLILLLVRFQLEKIIPLLSAYIRALTPI